MAKNTSNSESSITLGTPLWDKIAEEKLAEAFHEELETKIGKAVARQLVAERIYNIALQVIRGMLKDEDIHAALTPRWNADGSEPDIFINSFDVEEKDDQIVVKVNATKRTKLSEITIDYSFPNSTRR